MLKCGGVLEHTQCFGMHPARMAEGFIDHFAAPLKIPDTNTAARRRRSLDNPERNELVDQLPRA